MKKLQLLSTVAASLLLVGAAAAQGSKDQAAPERAPAAQQNAPAEKVAPPMHSGQSKSSETTGQSSHDTKASPDKSSQDMKSKAPETTGQSSTNDKSSGASKDMKSSPDTSKSSSDTSKSSSPSAKSASDSNGGTKGKSEESAQGKSGTSTKSSQSGSPSTNATTGQGAAAGSAKLSTEQRTRITSIIKKEKVKPVKLNVSVTVGTRVPASVHFYPLPTEVVAVYPSWRGFDYILVGDQIVVIDPGTHEIVAIIEA